MQSRSPARPATRRSATALLAAALTIGGATLSACTPQDGERAPERTLGIEQSPIMNGYNTNREQALLTMEVLTITPMDAQGFSEDLFRVDPDAVAVEAEWGRAGIDNPHCTVPQAALLHDGHDISVDDSTCEVTDGLWRDPLSGETATLDEVEARGFLPPERVWASGGSQWDDFQASIYRNSPESVMTISDEAHEERGERGPDEWRPKDDALWCGYALRWVSEKNTFGLSMESQAEADALTEMLGTCPRNGWFVGQSA